MMPPWAAVAAHALAPTLFCKTLQDERQILRRSIYPSTGLRLQCNIWRGARLYRRTQTAHADVEKITKISRESYKVLTFAPPPDWPKIVTLPGSPPNAAMVSCTQRNAAIRSSMPRLPDSAYSLPPRRPRYRKPKTFSRWLTVTTTTSPPWHSRVPSNTLRDPDPAENPPPCSQTII